MVSINTQRGFYSAPSSATLVHTQWKKGQGTNPIPRRTPCAADTNHHTWRRHHLTNASTKLSFTHQARLPRHHTITTHYLYAPYGLQNIPLSLGEQTHLELGHIARSTIKTTLQLTTYHWTPGTRNHCRPTDPCSSLDRILSDYLICIRTLLRCSRSRHHSYESFCTLFSATLTLLCTNWWLPPQRPKHVVASYLHHIAKEI